MEQLTRRSTFVTTITFFSVIAVTEEASHDCLFTFTTVVFLTDVHAEGCPAMRGTRFLSLESKFRTVACRPTRAKYAESRSGWATGSAFRKIFQAMLAGLSVAVLGHARAWTQPVPLCSKICARKLTNIF